LENILGFELFIRNSRPLSLTEEAKVIFPYVDNSINSLKKGIRMVDSYNDFKIGKIILGVPSHISIFLVIDKIAFFTKKYPGIKIKIVSKPTKELLLMLRDNELDAIIDSSPIENIYNFNIKKISVEECVMACNIANKDLLNKKIKLSELGDFGLPLIVPGINSNNTKELIKIYKANNIEFNPMFEVTTSETIVEMVRKNIGIGYLFNKTVERYEYMGKINLDVQLPKFSIYVINKNNELSKVCREFLNCIV
jgi:DNA-binding transcriptional LysR family regulator